MTKPFLTGVVSFATICVLLMSTEAQSQYISYPTLGEGIRFMPQDSSALVNLSVRFQNQLSVEKPIHTNDEWESQMQVRRLRLKFSGFALSPRLEYKVELGLSPRDISPSNDFAEASSASKIIYDAVVRYSFARHFELWFGQAKLPGNRERIISSQDLQFVDRSRLNSLFNIDRDIGMQLHGRFKVGKAVVRPIVSVSMGEGRTLSARNIGGYDYTGRIEFLPLGDFEDKGDYFSSDLAREEKPKLSVGAAYDFNDGASRQNGQLGRFMLDAFGNYMATDLSTVFADLHFKYKGFSFLSEYAIKTASEKVISYSGLRYRTGSGFSVQSGYLFKGDWEIAARYTTVSPDDAAFSAIEGADEYTLGFSKYLKDHNLKIQSDFSYHVPQTGDEGLRFRLQLELGI